MGSLNIGIVAHVDAGKTSLTERLLHHTGVIDQVGSVDAGSTQTDSMEMERRRGITIRSAVVSFTIDGLQVNLIDTPGHPDFIAEVERALRVLDGAVLVVSSVEGVQAQTHILMRTLTRLRIPVLIFANKIDRGGARYHELLDDIGRKLTPRRLAMSTVTGSGTAQARSMPLPLSEGERAASVADLLAEVSDTFLESYLSDTTQLTDRDYRAELVRQVRQAQVVPVYFGSAVTGEGVDDLLRAIRELLPPSAGDPSARLRASVFKIDWAPGGEKVAYARVYSGRLAAREPVDTYRRARTGGVVEGVGKVTSVRVFAHGTTTRETAAGPGDIATVYGLAQVRVGDQLGSPDGLPSGGFFAPPSLETVVRAARPEQNAQFYQHLLRLAEEDPLINVRRNETDRTISVALYGEVQREVVKGLMLDRHGIEMTFEETTTVYVEKVEGTGHGLEVIWQNEFAATVGLRIEPGAPGTGVRYRIAVEPGGLPAAFHKAIEETVRRTLRQGLFGWEVVDCVVTLTDTAYSSPITSAGDFRRLTPLVLMAALRTAGTTVHEPVNRFELEVPDDTVHAVTSRLVAARAVVDRCDTHGPVSHLQGTIPASNVHDIERQLPGLSHGEGVFVSTLTGHRRTTGTPPVRPRTDGNPLNRREYLTHVLGRG
ncbi:TetM/TetW/TetO/TetS family tetracycline resistance ribosomal protection protein [Micromonospora sp. HM134]|uniref:elongation factor G n=1 Tax=Micromonospora sp. HM134 TaxID=2583243 RepID=UPI001198A61A|nr:TetM/TetW/TetO/TetS family tetracycline resistance ribosomal protection protein [Micromonospora sp. HM134]QDY07987.1 TetM/TetW/TetO/TetS family tetracycline resistance ribosomal protection protein [Micromonospora sp. HM134]